MILHAIGPTVSLETRAFKPVEQADSTPEAIGGDFRLGVVGRFLGILDDKRLKSGAEKTGADRTAADTHDVRQIELALAELADDRATDVGVLDRGGRNIAGVKLVSRTLVIALFVGHRADEGNVFHGLGDIVPALGNRDSRHSGRDGTGLASGLRAGLGIEGLELAGATGHPEEDARHLSLSHVVGVKRHPIGEADGDTGGDCPPPATPRPIVCRKWRRPITPPPFIVTWTISFSKPMSIPSSLASARVRNSVELIRLQ